MLKSHKNQSRSASALVSALALLVVVTTLTLGLVLQFSRWRGEYRAERLYMEQLLIQPDPKSNSPETPAKPVRSPIPAEQPE